MKVDSKILNLAFSILCKWSYLPGKTVVRNYFIQWSFGKYCHSPALYIQINTNVRPLLYSATVLLFFHCSFWQMNLSCSLPLHNVLTLMISTLYSISTLRFQSLISLPQIPVFLFLQYFLYSLRIPYVLFYINGLPARLNRPCFPNKVSFWGSLQFSSAAKPWHWRTDPSHISKDCNTNCYGSRLPWDHATDESCTEKQHNPNPSPHHDDGSNVMALHAKVIVGKMKHLAAK